MKKLFKNCPAYLRCLLPSRSLAKIVSLYVLLILLQSNGVLLGQCRNYPVSLSERVIKSAHIVKAQVKTKYSYWNTSRTKIYTLWVMEVKAILKGQPLSEIGVITEGGRVDDQMMLVQPKVELASGQEYLLFLEADNQTLRNNSFPGAASLIQAVPYALNQGILSKQKGQYRDLLSEKPQAETQLFSKILNSLGKRTAVTPLGRPYTFQTSNSAGARIAAASVTSVTPANVFSGGIQQESVITIAGSGFGSTAGTIEFANADNGGATFIQSSNPATDIVSWSDTEIKVRVPTLAGTGNLAINGTTAGSISVVHAQESIYDSFLGFSADTRQRVEMANFNGSGGYTFVFHNTFSGNSAAVGAFRRALTNWACKTGVNFSIGSTSVSSPVSEGADGINVINFGSLPNGVLGVCYKFLTADASAGCQQYGTYWRITGIDFIFRSPTAVSWNFSQNAPTSSQYDFESVALHELGHAVGLGHVINTNNVMHYVLGNGETRRVLDASSAIAGGVYKVNHSVATKCLSRSPHETPMLRLNLAASASLSGGATIGAGSSTNLTVSFTGQGPWSFSLSDGTTVANTTNNPHTVTVSPVSTTTYSLTSVSNVCGTGTTSGTAIVTVNPTPASPAITSFSPGTGSSSMVVTISGSRFTGTTSVHFNGSIASFTVNSDSQITATIPTGAATGPITVTTAAGTAGSANNFTVTQLTNLIVSSHEQISGTYNNVTITGTGTGTLAGDLTVMNTLLIESGGTLSTGIYAVKGNSAFTLSAGAVLRIGAPQGITASGTSGAIQVAGTRTFHPDALYEYNGAVAQATGNGLPTTVKDLTINNSSGVTLSQLTTVRGILTLLTGALTANNNLTVDLTSGLISGAGNGSISGNVTARRQATGSGFHYLAAPLSNGTVNDYLDDVSLTNSGAYAYYTYDETNPSTDRNQGWTPVTSSSTSLQQRGVAINLSGTTTFDITRTYTHQASPVYSGSFLTNTGAYGDITTANGWHLISNPFPSPFNWDDVSVLKQDVANAIYFYNPATGQNASYINGIGLNGASNTVPAMQAFWVKVTGQSPSLTLGKNARSLYTAQPFFRTAALQNVLKLTVKSGTHSDETAIRFAEEATDGIDNQYDAVKFKNGPGNPNLFSLCAEAMLAVNTLAGLHTSPRKVPLFLEVPADGNFVLSASKLESFAPGTRVMLEDRTTKQITDLSTNPHYTFTAAKSDSAHRFTILFYPAPPTSPTPLPDNGISLKVSTFTDEAHLLFEGFSHPTAEVRVYNTVGQQVALFKNISTRRKHVMGTKHMGSGLYIVTVVANKEIATCKFFLNY